jgi:protein-export membrane protein SecD
MKLSHRVLFVIFLVLLTGSYIFPWGKVGISIPFLEKPFTLGLDLQGWVELDYKVDLDAVVQQGSVKWTTQTIVEGIKSVIDKRVNSLGLAEPTIQTADYGGDTHIIVQIPTKDYGDITEEEKKKRNAEDIVKAKETIGKVVQLEFREEKTSITEEDRQERRNLADKALADLQTTPFDTVSTKYTSQYERVLVSAGSGQLPASFVFPELSTATTFPLTSKVLTLSGGDLVYTNASGMEEIVPNQSGYAIVRVDSRDTTTGTGTANYQYSYIFFDEKPSTWKAAETADGKILNDKYLVSAGVGFTQGGTPQVELTFNDEWKKIFAELTKRLLGKEIAIFVGGELLTAPTVQAVIPDGRAVITGQYTIQTAQELANNINTGIVPAPIYLTSERTIDAKIGASALSEILWAGAVGLLAIIIFLTVYYRVSGLLAGLALIIYTIFLIALVKFTGVVLTLASIAGIILSIGLAIDANILIFERMREALREGNSFEKSTTLGFDKSWTAIWDSHVTSLTVAFILYIFGISLIKGFGLMLGIGIVLSLFTAMWVSRVLILVVGKRMSHNMNLFIGMNK